jgi:tetratricopeptide (TPR) repeat protein
LAPVIGLLQVGAQAHADRYAYVPHIGLFVLIVWEARRYFAVVPRPAETGAAAAAPGSRRALWPIGVTAFLVGACTIAAREQMETWRNSDALWARALQLDPEHPVAHLQLARRDLHAGDLDAAEARFRRVLFRQPQDHKAVLGLAQVHERREDWDRAAEHYAWVLRLNPNDQFAAHRLAELRPQHASRVEAPRPDPRPEAVPPFRAGLAAYRSGRTAAALQGFLDAARIDPNYADAHNNAALALKELGRQSEARSHFEAAVALAPDSADFRLNLAVLLEELGERTLAREHYEALLRLSPSNPEPALRIERLNRP